MLAEIDAAICQKLQPLRDALSHDGVLVRGLPDETGEYGDANNAGDVVTLIKSGRAKAPDGDAIIQDQNLALRVLIELPRLYSKDGVYDVYEQVVELLLGYKPPKAKGKLYLDSWDFYRDKDVSRWVIEMDFVIPVRIKEEIEQEVAPLLTEITYNDSSPFPAGVFAHVGGVGAVTPTQPETQQGLDEISFEIYQVGVRQTAEAAVNVWPGQPIVLNSQGRVELAIAALPKNGRVDGFALEFKQAGYAVMYSKDGLIERSDWTGIAWAEAHLTPDNDYFLSPDRPGSITRFPPESEGFYVTKVGRAQSTTTLAIEISDPILL